MRLGLALVTQLSLEYEAMRRERKEIERNTNQRTQQLQAEYEQRLELERYGWS